MLEVTVSTHTWRLTWIGGGMRKRDLSRMTLHALFEWQKRSNCHSFRRGRILENQVWEEKIKAGFLDLLGLEQIRLTGRNIEKEVRYCSTK